MPELVFIISVRLARWRASFILQSSKVSSENDGMEKSIAKAYPESVNFNQRSYLSAVEYLGAFCTKPIWPGSVYGKYRLEELFVERLHWKDC